MDLLHNAEQGGYKPMKIDNGCSTDKADKKKRLFHVYIMRNQLMYDVNAQLLIIARARRTRNNVQDNNLTNIEDFQPMINRWIDKYKAQAESLLQAYVLKEFSKATTDTINNSDELHFHFAMPDSWDETVFTQLKQAIHDYLVSGVMYEDLSLTLTTKDPVTLSQREQNELLYQDIKRLACAMKTRVRKALHPFP
jgi:hypothetical protein